MSGHGGHREESLRESEGDTEDRRAEQSGEIKI